MAEVNNNILKVRCENGFLVNILFYMLRHDVYISSPSSDFKQAFGDFVIKVPLECLDTVWSGMKGKSKFIQNFRKAFEETGFISKLNEHDLKP